MTTELRVGTIETEACDYDSIYFLGEKITECLEKYDIPECAKIRVMVTWLIDAEGEEDTKPST